MPFNSLPFLVARVLLGHSSASSMVAAPIYTSETSQPQVRKTTGAFTMICYTTGYGLAVVFGIMNIFQNSEFGGSGV